MHTEFALFYSLFVLSTYQNFLTTTTQVDSASKLQSLVQSLNTYVHSYTIGHMYFYCVYGYCC